MSWYYLTTMKHLTPQSLSAIFIMLFFYSCEKNREERQFDEEIGQQEVLTKEGIDKVLAEFETISYADTRPAYRKYSDPNGDFQNQLSSKTFRIVKGREVFKYIVGSYRIKDFVSGDKYRHANKHHLDENYEQYWLVDDEMLYMILEFILKLDELGYDKYGFRVRESHRHPLCNHVRGGASKSQHINGKAVDMVVEDINKDGKKNQADKTICLEILEELVGERGGIGRYPGSMTIHIDSRGYGARWDSY